MMELPISRSSLVLTAAILSLSACRPTTPPISPSFEAVALANQPRLAFSWRERIQDEVPWAYLPQEYATPVFVRDKDDIIVGSTDGSVQRLRAGSGERIWRVSLDLDNETGQLPVHTSPLVTKEGTILAATLAGSLHALDYSDGTELWVWRAEDAIEAPMAQGEGRVFLTDSREILYALDSSNGKVLWRYQRRAPEFFTIKGTGTPVLDGDAIYCGFADGTLAAVQIDTGEAIWTTSLTNEETEFIDVDVPVIIDKTVLYAASYAGGIFAVSREDGSIVWRAPVEGVSSLSLYEGTLYAASAQGRVVALDPDTRQFIWSFKFAEHIPVEVTAQGPYLFVSHAAGPLVVLDRASGKPLAEWHPSTGFNVPVIFEGSRGFVFSNGGYLYSFELAY